MLLLPQITSLEAEILNMNALDPVGVTIKMLLDAGRLNVGQKIHPLNGKAVFGVILADGKIEVELNSRKKSYISLSGAARAVEDLSVNGWTYWYTDVDGQKKPLTETRTEYLNSKK